MFTWNRLRARLHGLKEPLPEKSNENFSYLCSTWNFINQRKKLIKRLNSYSKHFYLFLQGNVRAMRDILKNAKPTRKFVFFLPKKTELIELNIYCIGRQYLLLKMRSAFEQNDQRTLLKTEENLYFYFRL